MLTIDPYLEQQYNNRKAVPNYADYLLDWEKRSVEFRAHSKAHLNVPYGPGERDVFDIFPVENANAPLHIFIHGGYWQALNKDSFSFMAEAFNRRGENAIILNYDLCPKVSISEITAHIKIALSTVLSQQTPYPLNTNNIQITGHSAGGHLAAEMLCVDWESMGFGQSPFRRVTSLSGLFDLSPLTKTSVNQALQLDDDQARLNSPLLKRPFVDDATELNLIVGELESQSYISQSEDLALQWKHKGFHVQCTLALQQNHFSLLQHFLDQNYRTIT